MLRHLLPTLTLAVLPQLAVADPYAPLIADAATSRMPDTAIRESVLLRAVLETESGMDPMAVSPAGAQGIAQFMPATWAEVSVRLGHPEASPFDVAHAIPAAAQYLTTLYGKWTTERHDRERWSLALASYNAGFGNILTAQERCGGCIRYADIARQLPAVTGPRNARETTDYVTKIWERYDGR